VYVPRVVLFFLGKEELKKKEKKIFTFCFISRALHQHSNTHTSNF